MDVYFCKFEYTQCFVLILGYTRLHAEDKMFCTSVAYEKGFFYYSVDIRDL